MTDRSRATPHAEGCWSWGPGHYECAVREIERLREQLSAETRMWYTTADARRDAENQAAIRERANLPSPQCSTFCAYDAEGRCVVTEDGKCDARRAEGVEQESRDEQRDEAHAGAATPACVDDWFVATFRWRTQGGKLVDVD